jgi:hypothetical protein
MKKDESKKSIGAKSSGKKSSSSGKTKAKPVAEVKPKEEVKKEQPYEELDSEYSVDEDFSVSGSLEKKPAGPTTTKDYIANKTGDNGKTGSALFKHSKEDKEAAAKKTKDEIQVSSEAIVKDKMKDLQLEGGSVRLSTSNSADDFQMLDESLKGLSKKDADKLK